jgi:hypothetical protein
MTPFLFKFMFRCELVKTAARHIERMMVVNAVRKEPQFAEQKTKSGKRKKIRYCTDMDQNA